VALSAYPRQGGVGELHPGVEAGARIGPYGSVLVGADLEKEGVIAASRARITVLDRKGLQKRSNGTYVPTDA
jgi:hypothetical protein